MSKLTYLNVKTVFYAIKILQWLHQIRTCKAIQLVSDGQFSFSASLDLDVTLGSPLTHLSDGAELDCK